MIKTATVHIWGQRVGAVTWDEKRRVATFEYDPMFQRRNLDLSPFVMPIAGTRSGLYSFPELSRTDTFKGLPGLLADALPDKYGKALINSWLTRHKRSTDSFNPVEHLCFTGNRAMGALEFQPATYPSVSTSTQLEVADMIRITEQLLNDKKSVTARLTDQEEKSMLEVLKVGTSAGGARAKAVIAYNPKTNQVRSGQTDAPEGFEHWLIKFDGIQDGELGLSNGYGKVEMAYYLMATAAGIQMNECRLFKEHRRAHFMTKRFDRLDGNKKVHVQSFCALKHADFNETGLYSYEQVFETIRQLNLPYTQQEQFFRRMVFNVIARNCDDHTKNIAFVMDEMGEWSLSPAYDICHAYRPGSQWVSEHSISINGKTKDIERKDLHIVAKRMSIKKADSIIDEIATVVAQWQQYAEEVGVKHELTVSIDQTLLPGFEEFKEQKTRVVKNRPK